MINLHDLSGNPVITFFEGIGSAWLISLIKHWPAPKKRSLYIGAVFDATQDTVKNNERVGQRRDAPEPGAAEPANQENQK